MDSHPSDDLRTLANWFEPDPRSGAQSPIPPRRTFERHLAEVACLRLNDSVPWELRVNFLTACNVMLYSWFVYRFAHVAEMQALGALEWALRERLEPRTNAERKLKTMLKTAVKQGLLHDAGLRAFQRRVDAQRRAAEEQAQWPEEYRRLFGSPAPKPDPDPQVIVKRLCDSIPLLRNTIAHGSPLLMVDGCLRVELCADLINQLYPATVAPRDGCSPTPPAAT